MLLELLASLLIVMYEVVAIASSVFMIADMSEVDSTNRNVQTILNSSNQSTLLATRSDGNVKSRDYVNGSMHILQMGHYFAGMTTSLLDETKHSIVFRRKIDGNDYDFFLAQFDDNVNGKFAPFSKMGCFGIYQHSYANSKEMNSLVKCSDSIKYSIRYSKEGIYYIDMDYYGKLSSFILTFEYVNDRNVY